MSGSTAGTKVSLLCGHNRCAGGIFVTARSASHIWAVASAHPFTLGIAIVRRFIFSKIPPGFPA
jgi:hypothetical protein